MSDANDPRKTPADETAVTLKTPAARPAADSEQTVKTSVPPGAAPASPGPASLGPADNPDVTFRLSPQAKLRMLQEGSVVAGRYKIERILGVGGMGVVYQALDQALGIQIALKVLRPEVAQDEEFLERFRNELLIARQVTHRNVVRLHDIGEHEGLYYMSMDLVTGRSLQDMLKEERQLEPAEAMRIFLQIARALAEAHRQSVVHRDLKPANILLGTENGEAYISDFGIARSLSVQGLTQTGVVVGTPHYLSPEQARGEKVGAPSDIYSLGIIFVEMLSGKLPFTGGTLLEILAQRITGHRKSLAELGVEVDPGLAAVIDRCLATAPEDRYASATELVDDLEDLERPAERVRQEKRRRFLVRASWAAAALAALVLVVVAVVRFLPAPREEVTAPPAPPPAAEAVPAKARYSVAVLPFRGAEGRDDLAWASTGIAEMVSAALAESEDLRVVESLRVFQTLQDLGFAPGQIREDQMAQLAEVFEANRLVAGSLRATGETVLVEARLVEVDRPGSPARKLEPLQGQVTDLFDLVAELGASLREALEVEDEAVAAVPLTASPTAMEAYTRGLDFLSRSETLKAAPELERSVAEDPDFAAAWVRLAQTYEELGRFDEALEAARESVRAAGTSSGRLGYEARAREALLRGENETAQRFLAELVERYPNDTGAHIALAEAYGQEGRFTEAVERLKRAVEIDGSQPRAWYLLGRFSIMAGDARRAVDEYLVQALIQHRTLRNEQGRAEVHNAFGVAYQNLGQLDEAATSYRTAAELRERLGDRRGLATSLKNLAMVELIRGDDEAAEGHFTTALRIHEELGNRPGIAELQNALGVLEEERGRYREALEAYRAALQTRKDLGDDWALAESRANVGYSYYLLGEYDNAVLFLEKGLDLYRQLDEARGTVLILQSLGFCQTAQGQWTKASVSFLDALNLAREGSLPTPTAVSHGNLGLLAQNEGRYRAAFESYGEALSILEGVGDVQGQVEYLLREAEAYLELGSAAEADARLARVVELQADDANREDRATLLRLRGRSKALRGESDAAGRFFAEAVAEAEASRHAAMAIAARIDAGIHQLTTGDAAQALRDLRATAEDAERLGHALLKLRSAAALARAQLESGDAEGAEETLRQALRLAESRDANGYGGTYRLRQLLAVALEGLGRADAAGRARRDATADLKKVRDEVPQGLLPNFDALPAVAKIAGASVG